MDKSGSQMDLFNRTSLNPIHEVKRQIRRALSASRFSRDEVVDRMNAIAREEGIHKTVSKATLDSWTKDSDPDRMPSLFWLVTLCHVLRTEAPISALVQPLDCAVMTKSDRSLLLWARAEMEKRRVTKRARLALQMIEEDL